MTWRCFHCDESFSVHDKAREHFGPNEMHQPACQIDIAKYRAMEERVRRCNEEDTDLHREIYGLQSKHATELRREEEKGYAKGLADAAREAAKRVYPKDITPELRDVLGMMNFQTCPIAHGFRDAGASIPRKVEEEQAYVLHWLIGHVLAAGPDWRKAAAVDLKTAADAIKAKKDAS